MRKVRRPTVSVSEKSDVVSKTTGFSRSLERVRSMVGLEKSQAPAAETLLTCSISCSRKFF